MKKITFILFLSLSLAFLSSCTSSKNADIVTTMFPQYDFARQIVGDKLSVSLLLPPGVEVHSYEATSKDMVAIKNAQLFIFTSLDIDTWIKDPSTIGGKDTVVMNLSEHYTLEDHEHDHLLPDETEADEHDHGDELHYWVDPLVALQLIDAILEEIIQIDPINENFYRTNAENYHELIHQLHESFDSFIQDGHVDQDIFFAGHNAMGLFGLRYHLTIESLFESFKPDADLTSSELIQFTTIVTNANVHYLFIEELAQPKAAIQIQQELKKNDYTLELLELHAYHNLTKTEMEEGVSYVDLFERNIEYITLALTQNHD